MIGLAFTLGSLKKALLLSDPLVLLISQKRVPALFQNTVLNKKDRGLSYGSRNAWAITQVSDVILGRWKAPQPGPEHGVFDSELRTRVRVRRIPKYINRLTYEWTYSIVGRRSTSYCGYKQVPVGLKKSLMNSSSRVTIEWLWPFTEFLLHSKKKVFCQTS